jgi:dephospho-CoA kinase
MLAARGAEIIDADLIGHELIMPGQPAWQSLVEQFGDEITIPGSLEIDRRLLGEIVFDNPDKLAALNAIVHPAILGRIADELEQLRGTDAIVVIDAALIMETGLDRACDVVVVVDAAPQSRIERVRSDRGLSVDQIQARMAAQKDRSELLARADINVVNDGSLEDLNREADRVWRQLERLGQ